jgi:hypothetical protein
MEEDDYLKIMIKLINNLFQSGEWLKDCTEDKMIALNKKSEAAKRSDHRTISSLSYIQQI